MFKVGGVDEVERAYRELAFERGVQDDPSLRPTAGELYRMGYLPSRLRQHHGSWFEFIRGEGNLTSAELAVMETASDFLREIEISEMTKSFKMVTLEGLCEDDRLLQGMPLKDLALRCRGILRRSPELLTDISRGLPHSGVK